MRNFKAMVATAATMALVGCGGGTADTPDYPHNGGGNNPDPVNPGNPQNPPVGEPQLLDCSAQYPNPDVPDRDKMLRELSAGCSPFGYKGGTYYFPPKMADA